MWETVLNHKYCFPAYFHPALSLGEEVPVPADGFKPAFTERPVTRQSDDGKNIIFECRCIGDPKPTYTWQVFYFSTLSLKLITLSVSSKKSTLRKHPTILTSNASIFHPKILLTESKTHNLKVPRKERNHDEWQVREWGRGRPESLLPDTVHNQGCEAAGPGRIQRAGEEQARRLVGDH